MEEAERLGRLEVRMDQVEAGVTNFRDFQKRANTFFDRFDAIADEDEKIAKERWTRSQKLAAASILVVCLLPPVGWSTAQAVRFLGDVYAIVQEWHETHKGEIQKKSWFTPSNPVVASKQKLEAGNDHR